MNPKPVRPQVAAIQDRFFKALETCVNDGKIAGLQTFCKEYGLDRPKYVEMRLQFNDPKRISRYKFIDIDAMSYLVKDFGVSADWLLLGKGKMLK